MSQESIAEYVVRAQLTRDMAGRRRVFVIMRSSLPATRTFAHALYLYTASRPNLLDGENEDVGLAAFHSCSATNFAKNSIGFSDKSSSWPRCLGLGMLERVHEFELLLCLQVDAYEGPRYSMIRLDVGDGEKRRRWFGGVFDGLQGLMI